MDYKVDMRKRSQWFRTKNGRLISLFVEKGGRMIGIQGTEKWDWIEKKPNQKEELQEILNELLKYDKEY